MPVINLELDQRLFNSAYFPSLFTYEKRYNVYYGG